eukprot:CAMPEP_0179464960 /NCGR_PEP_ID=MMETSP0799-20121207/46656_1 /TAXON_ID=46947 /ORGANISM="Geminigera cryophila, Strain CCMP2564" /LENGTH=68 /DNA_ID=CAMNT_0021269025 /DNA_START=90 /DNA_END=292 /DNA_ORIENTATION=-
MTTKALQKPVTLVTIAITTPSEIMTELFSATSFSKSASSRDKLYLESTGSCHKRSFKAAKWVNCREAS